MFEIVLGLMVCSLVVSVWPGASRGGSESGSFDWFGSDSDGGGVTPAAVATVEAGAAATEPRLEGHAHQVRALDAAERVVRLRRRRFRRRDFRWRRGGD